jgi:hypothetical protein
MTTSLHVVDSAARKEYAALLRRFAAGVITNREFERRMPDWREITLREIDWAVWPLYDDLHEHKLVGDYHVTPSGRECIARMILFLRSDLPYRWPRETGLAQLPALLLSVLTLGRFGKWWFRYRAPDGDQSVWPFYTSAEYEEALTNPPYLRGTQVI